MTPTILPDPLAIHLLSTITGARLRATSPVQPPAPDLLEALTETFGPAPTYPATPAPTQADLARAALVLAAEDPVLGDAIAVILDRDTVSQETFPIGETIALAATLTAALSVLQTELTFERTPAGKYKVKLHKKAASDGLLEALARTLMRVLGAGDGKGAPKLPK